MNSTIASVELQIRLDAGSGVPLYRQIILQIEHAILSGRVRSGYRLPTIRALAIELQINPNTIAKAYNELEIRGIVLTQVGSGTYVSDKKPQTHEEGLDKRIREILIRFLRDMENLGLAREEIIELIRDYREEKA